MRRNILSVCAVLVAVAGCADSPTHPLAGTERARSLAYPEFSSEQDAIAALGGYTDAIASAGAPQWHSSTVSTLGYYQFRYANVVDGRARIRTFGADARESSWLPASLQRLLGGNGTWEAIQSTASVPITQPCDLSAQASAEMTAKYAVLVPSGFTTIFTVPDADDTFNDQGACSAEQVGDGSGGGSGGENDESDSGCGWYVWQAQDEDGRWYDISDEFYACFGEDATAKRSTERLSSPFASASSRANANGVASGVSRPPTRPASRVSFVATAGLEGAGVALVQPDETGAPTVIVDTSRASASDVEASLMMLNEWLKSDPASTVGKRLYTGKNLFGGALKPQSLARSGSILHALKASGARRSVGKYKGRSITVPVDLPGTETRRPH
jgi:hypothetical protein